MRIRWLLERLGVTFVIVGAAAIVPRILCGRDADAWFEGDPVVRDPLADAVAARDLGGVDAAAFHTGSARFDGEWALGTAQMAVLGLAQAIDAAPARRAALLPALRRAADTLVAPATRAFGTAAWGDDGLADLERGRGHAYLGYIALALGALERTDPTTPHAVLADRLCAELARRLATSADGTIETYPGETYPPDLAVAAAAIALHARTTGRPSPLPARWFADFRARHVSSTGYLVQSTRGGRPLDAPRGSGTALAAYALSVAGLHDEARPLLVGLREHGLASLAGLGGIREYAPGHAGRGDIDSGPILLGVSVAATGFSLAAARALDARAVGGALYRTTHLFGVPARSGRFVAGGPLGNAILLAMLTAPRGGVR
jgi:hypothetical protein